MIRNSVYSGLACKAKRLVVTLGVVVTALIVLAAPGLYAGSVFMKNGYIIQGPIVDYTDEVVVLGWSNGKAYIHKRFYESVDLDSAEQAEIERRRLEASEADESAIPEDEVVITGNFEEELPEDFQEFVSIVVPDLMDGDAGSDSGFLVDPEGLIDGAVDTGFDPVTDPDMVGSVDQLAPRQFVAEIGVSVSPPNGWVREEGTGNVRWAGDAATDQFLPSVVIVSAPVTPDWSVDDAVESLRHDPAVAFDDFEVLEVNQIIIGGRQAHEVVGEGVADGAAGAGSTTVNITPVLVPGEDSYWIISAFASEGTDAVVQTAMRPAVESVEFLDKP